MLMFLNAMLGWAGASLRIPLSELACYQTKGDRTHFEDWLHDDHQFQRWKSECFMDTPGLISLGILDLALSRLIHAWEGRKSLLNYYTRVFEWKEHDLKLKKIHWRLKPGKPGCGPVAAWDPSGPSRPEDAKKAVATFDHGELNGKIIRVNITG